MKKILGFSLVELMISLIVISVVTAAFAPIITKKLKTSDISVSSASVSDEAGIIKSNALCNVISKGCTQCKNDECLEVEEGYFINETTNKSELCSDYGCISCNSPTDCSGCLSGFFQDGTKCESCIDNCKLCSNTTKCEECNSGYFLSASNKCFNYKCSGIICELSVSGFKTLSIYRYNVGDGGIAIPSGISICYAGKSCGLSSDYTPACWKTNGSGNTSAGCGATATFSSYNTCTRTVCNWYAANKIEIASNKTGWHLPNSADTQIIEERIFTETTKTLTPDPFCASSLNNKSSAAISSCSNIYNCNAKNGQWCFPQHYHMYGLTTHMWSHWTFAVYGTSGSEYEMAYSIVLVK